MARETAPKIANWTTQSRDASPDVVDDGIEKKLQALAEEGGLGKTKGAPAVPRGRLAVSRGDEFGRAVEAAAPVALADLRIVANASVDAAQLIDGGFIDEAFEKIDALEAAREGNGQTGSPVGVPTEKAKKSISFYETRMKGLSNDEFNRHVAERAEDFARVFNLATEEAIDMVRRSPEVMRAVFELALLEKNFVANDRDDNGEIATFISERRKELARFVDRWVNAAKGDDIPDAIAFNRRVRYIAPDIYVWSFKTSMIAENVARIEKDPPPVSDVTSWKERLPGLIEEKKRYLLAKFPSFESAVQINQRNIQEMKDRLEGAEKELAALEESGSDRAISNARENRDRLKKDFEDNAHISQALIAQSLVNKRKTEALLHEVEAEGKWVENLAGEEAKGLSLLKTSTLFELWEKYKPDDIIIPDTDTF